MKNLVLLLWLALASVCAGADGYTKLCLIWDRSPDSTVIGYKAYWWVTNNTNVSIFDAGSAWHPEYAERGPGWSECAYSTNGSIVLTNTWTSGVTYGFFVTCYNGSGLESDPSNTIYFTVPFLKPPRPPGTFNHSWIARHPIRSEPPALLVCAPSRHKSVAQRNQVAGHYLVGIGVPR